MRLWLAARLRLFSSKTQGGTRYLTIPMSERRADTKVSDSERAEKTKIHFRFWKRARCSKHLGVSGWPSECELYALHTIHAMGVCVAELIATQSHILESSLIRAAFVKVLVWNRRPPGRLWVFSSKRTLTTQVSFVGLRIESGFATAQVFSSPTNINKTNSPEFVSPDALK